MSTSPAAGTVSSRSGRVHYLRGVSAQSVRLTYGQDRPARDHRTGDAMTSERRTAVVVVLMLLGAGGVGVAAGALMGRSDRTSRASAQAAPGCRRRVERADARRPRHRPRAAAPCPCTCWARPQPAPGSTASSAPRPRPTRSRARSPGWRSRRATRTTAPPWLGLPAQVSRAGTTATVTFGRPPALAGATAHAGRPAGRLHGHRGRPAGPRGPGGRARPAGGRSGRPGRPGPGCWRRSGCSTRSTAARPAPG